MGRNYKGHIYQRGACGAWYYRLRIHGKEKTIRLLNLDGTPVKSESEALESAERMARCLVPNDRAEQLRRLKADLQTAEETEAEGRLRAINESARVESLWEIYMSCPHRHKSCKDEAETERITTASCYMSYCRGLSAFLLGKCRLVSEVTREMAVEWLGSSEMADGTYNKKLTFMKSLWNTLMKDGKIMCDANPFLDIEPRSGDYRSRSELSKEQIQSLFDNADGEVKALFILGYYTGLRRGDCCTLRWDEVDLEKRVIRRIPSKTSKRAKDPKEAMVKIGIPDELFMILGTFERQGEYVLPGLAGLYTNRRDAVTRQVNAVFRKAGIQTSQKPDGAIKRRNAIIRYGFHSLRYSYISHHGEIGTPQSIVQKNAGHRNPAMTEHYTRISDEAAARYAKAFSDSPKKGENGEAMSDEEMLSAIKALLRKK